MAQATALRTRLIVTHIVIHRIRYAVSSDVCGGFIQTNRFCPHPKKSVGAGDHFNARIALELALGCDAADSLALGRTTSGFYVRNARGASREELV